MLFLLEGCKNKLFAILTAEEWSGGGGGGGNEVVVSYSDLIIGG